MKMKTEHFESLRRLIERFQKEDLEQGRKHYQEKGLTARRYRFDVLYSIPRGDRQAWFDQGVYDYLNDDHIDTALKALLGNW
ncbi:hypothetical protein HBN99_03535 [Pseudomonas oryzihabitans]|uniref:hypothetical protein n=1 Tax=Pseudomonas oryzihabitans TaxID=47885 RepID=UPI00147550EC|nr:hypothetical protein [Pseudomonas oryzihabitans]NMZ63393.1 hypothetical protein [Pseudomonas oryzihabitans]